MPPRKKKDDAADGANSAADLLSMMKLEPVDVPPPDLPGQEGGEPPKARGRKKVDVVEVPDLPEPVPDVDPSRNYFVGWVHQVGVRKEEVNIKVFASNDIAADRKTWGAGVPQGLKTHRALACKNGNADEVVAAFVKMYSAKQVKSSDWFIVSKKSVEEFADKFAENPDYEIVTEAKAKLKMPRGKK